MWLSEKGAVSARDRLNDLLTPVGFNLRKSTDADTTIRHLGGGMSASWLGFDISVRDGETRYEIPETAMGHLFERLRVGDAEPAAIGWFCQMGPTYPFMRRDQVFGEVFRIASAYDLSLQELYPQLKEHWRRGWRDWCRLKSRLN